MSEDHADMNSWYITNIEEPIREHVKLLRSNGFNTLTSCGYQMFIECLYIPDGEIQRLDTILFNAGYRNYTISVTVNRIEGSLFGEHIRIVFEEALKGNEL